MMETVVDGLGMLVTTPIALAAGSGVAWGILGGRWSSCRLRRCWSAARSSRESGPTSSRNMNRDSPDAAVAVTLVVEERQPHLRGGAREPLERDALIRKCAANLDYTGANPSLAEAIAEWADGLERTTEAVRPPWA